MIFCMDEPFIYYFIPADVDINGERKHKKKVNNQEMCLYATMNMKLIIVFIL